jgi:quercetin dioxygenase-like cupin family protein
MNTVQVVAILKRFEHPDEVRLMEKGRFEIVEIGGLMVGRAIYEPGWRWSEHVGPTVGKKLCPVAHVGYVVSGTATAAFEDGTVQALTPGTLFHVPPAPHDSWVVGEEAYVSIHFLGAEDYLR